MIKMKVMLGIHSEAIGHFIRETEILDYLIRNSKKIQGRKGVILCPQKIVSNSFFLRILSASYRILYWPFGQFIMRVLNRISRSQKTKSDLFRDRNHELCIRLHDAKSALLNAELEKEIYRHLHMHKKELGFSNYNIFAIRDSGYDKMRFRNFDIRDQEYRNTPINYFVPTFHYFESRNAKSLRVGRHNNTCITSVYDEGVEIASINCSNPDLCDFAIFLGAGRVYSTGTGVDDIGLFLRKETVYLNIAPFGTVPRSPLIKAILASDYFDYNGRRLSLKELIDKELHKVRPTNLIKSGQISVRPKNSESILRFVSFLEENRVEMTGMEAIEAMSEMGWGEQWENVLY